MADVLIATEARDAIENLPADERERVRTKLREAGDDPERYLLTLSETDLRAVRIGDYRALIEWDREDEALYVVAFGHRRNVYDRNL